MLLIAAAGALLAVPQFSFAQNASAKPDDSAQNKGQDETAQNQSNSRSDLQITAKIRRALMADKGLSMYARNVKIITRNGSVTLKGPVKSADERQRIESDAAGVVTQSKVMDQITVQQ
jgi:osmotically-inducible protein OsmY